MGLTGGIIAFLLIWWTVLFVVLPMGVKSVWEDEAPHVDGVEKGAPISPNLLAKIWRTTWISMIVWVVVFAIISSGVISLER